MKIFIASIIFFISTILAVVCFSSSSNNNLVSAHTIKHVVAVMLENRAMDHMLGDYGGGIERVYFPGNPYGKTPRCNDVDINDPTKGKVCASPNAYDVARCDPNHDAWAMDSKAYGHDAFKQKNFSDANMNGFVDTERSLHKADTDYCDVMKIFNRKTLPVMYNMVDEFTTFNRMFAFMNGPTWPNRLAALSGTSGGLTETSRPWYQDVQGQLYPQKTIFDQVLEAGKTATYVANDTWWELMMESTAHKPEILKLTTDLFEDARTGNLPAFSYVNPRAGCNVNTGAASQDMHPDHKVSEGEAYVKNIYEALRAGPAWNDTLLIYFFDEAGGFSDQVPLPGGAPAPDDLPAWPDTYEKFDRLGMRFPMILLSPWVPKNLIVQDPPSDAKPHPNSQFETTSIIGSIRKILGIPDVNLTKRDAFAARFDYLLNILDEPRTDCPMHLADAYEAPDSKKWIDTEKEKPLNSLQKYFAEVHGHLSGQGYPHHIKKQEHISEWLQNAAAEHKKITLKWKASKLNHAHSKKPHHQRKKKILDSLLQSSKKSQQKQQQQTIVDKKKIDEIDAEQFYLRCQSMIQDGSDKTSITNSWEIPVGYINTPYRTIATNLTLTTGQKEQYCITTSEDQEPGSEVGLALCYPTAAPRFNRDKYQWIVFGNDTTIRPYLSPNLCFTNNCFPQNSKFAAKSTAVTLELCSDIPTQKWSYQGNGGGMHENQVGTINFGDAIQALAVTKNKATSSP